MQNVGKLMMHRFKIILVELFDIDLLYVEVVHVVEGDFLPAFCRAEHHVTATFVGGRSDEVECLGYVDTEKIHSCQFDVSVHPDVFDDFRQCHRFVIVGGHEVVFMIALDILHAVHEVDVIRIGVVVEQPVVESISLQRFGREDAVRGVYLVVIVASPQADCGESKQRVNDLFLHNFHFFLC